VRRILFGSPQGVHETGDTRNHEFVMDPGMVDANTVNCMGNAVVGYLRPTTPISHTVRLNTAAGHTPRR
jgi:hypothetical protein